jgi:predicted nucleic acid-binding protein
MPGSVVLDASVAAKLYFTEDLSDLAEAAVRSADFLIAPDLLFIELASVAAKQVRRGASTPATGVKAMDLLHGLLDETVPLEALAKRAFELAARHGVSAYDGAYLALAEERKLQVLTADVRLLRRADVEGLSHLVRSLEA